MRQRDTVLDQIRKYDCTAFVDELLEEGPCAVREWFESRCEAPCEGPPPYDFNGWSVVAKKLSCALQTALEHAERGPALEFADLACFIYEQILPQMTEEVDAMGFGNLGVDLTEVEGIAIRIEIVNHFGPQPESKVASLDAIEKLVVRSLHTHCHVNLLEESDFTEILRKTCVANHLRILQKLNPVHRTPLLRRCLEEYSEPRARRIS